MVEETLFAVNDFSASLQGHVAMHKDDLVVVLNDSHYFWWRVRVLSSMRVGFVPAELLESDNERRARINKEVNAVVLAPVPLAHTKRGPTSPPTKCVRFESPPSPPRMTDREGRAEIEERLRRVLNTCERVQILAAEAQRARSVI